MPMKTWVDPNDPNSLRHLQHVFEGYRDWVTGLARYVYESPYSPGSARDMSWRAGWLQAGTDACQAPPRDRDHVRYLERFVCGEYRSGIEVD